MVYTVKYNFRTNQILVKIILDMHLRTIFKNMFQYSPLDLLYDEIQMYLKNYRNTLIEKIGTRNLSCCKSTNKNFYQFCFF